MTDSSPGAMPDHHAEIIAMLRTYAANAPESLQRAVNRALDQYEESGDWQNDDPSLYV